MPQTFLLPKARNTSTGQSVKIQDLTGGRYTTSQRSLAEDRARQLAESLTNRTGEGWVGYVEEYVPSKRTPK
jgi:hypothetical protein